MASTGTTAVVHVSCIPHTVFMESQDPKTGKLSRPLLDVRIPLAPDVAATLRSSVSLLLSSVHVELLLANGRVPQTYNTTLGAMRDVAMPKLDSMYIQADDRLYIGVRRTLPISSAHGGSPMRIVVMLLGVVYETNAFYVGARGAGRLLAPKFQAFEHMPEDGAAEPDGGVRATTLRVMQASVATLGVHVAPPQLHFALALPVAAPTPAPRRMRNKRKTVDADKDAALALTALQHDAVDEQ